MAAQDSTETSLELPVCESLQRRHSDVKLGGSSGGGGGLSPGGGGAGGLGAGLAPPRSPELRRHSDVSPASLKELEKVKSHVSVRYSVRVPSCSLPQVLTEKSPL